MQVPRLAGGAKDNTAAMVAVESLPDRKLGRVRMEVSPLANSTALVDFAQRTVAPGSTIRTDGARHLRVLSDLGYQHEYFVGLTSTQPAHINLPGVHLVASLLKRWLTGTLHYAASQEHLDYYLDEYTFRFNRRTSKARGLLSTAYSNKPSGLTRTPSKTCSRQNQTLTLT